MNDWILVIVEKVQRYQMLFQPTSKPADSKADLRFKVVSNQMHCNPLQGNYRVELLHREIPVIITGNEFADLSIFRNKKDFSKEQLFNSVL